MNILNSDVHDSKEGENSDITDTNISDSAHIGHIFWSAEISCKEISLQILVHGNFGPVRLDTS